MDASNAFNSLNRIAALWNVRVLWPSVLSLFLIHTEGGHLWYSEDMMHHFIVSHKAIHYRCDTRRSIIDVHIMQLVHFH